MGFESALLLTWAVCVVGVSALLHEFGHAWTARAVGWKFIGLRWHWYGIACVADPNGKPQNETAPGGRSRSQCGLSTTDCLLRFPRTGCTAPGC